MSFVESFWKFFGVIGIFLIPMAELASQQMSASVIITLETLKPHLAKIDLDTLTISGFSSGGVMSVTLHYMYSSKFKACGSFGGGPFGMMYNGSTHRSGRSSSVPLYILDAFLNVLPGTGRSAVFLEQQAIELSNQGLIDPIRNLKGSKSFVFQGGQDRISYPALNLSQKTVDMYKYFGSDVKDVFLEEAAHGVPTDNYGGRCNKLDLFHDAVNNCGSQSIFDMFSHFFGSDYVPPSSSTVPHTGKFFQFDQNPFAPSGRAKSDFMNSIGGIYVPRECWNANVTCKLHVALHGCYQSWYSKFSDLFAIKTGYFQVGDVNKMIILFPRVATLHFQDKKSNLACWDWFGGTTFTSGECRRFDAQSPFPTYKL